MDCVKNVTSSLSSLSTEVEALIDHPPKEIDRRVRSLAFKVLGVLLLVPGMLAIPQALILASSMKLLFSAVVIVIGHDLVVMGSNELSIYKKLFDNTLLMKLVDKLLRPQDIA